MHEIADMLQFGSHPCSNFNFIFMQVECFDKLTPIDQVFRLEFNVVKEKIDLFRSQGYVKNPESFFEHQVSDAA